MVAATKNKRGRPRNQDLRDRQLLEYKQDDPRSDRAAQNSYYVEEIGLFICDLSDYNPELYDFFTDARGKLRRRGILEQVGRMFYEGYYAGDGTLYELLKACMKAYNKGLSCKVIEQRLRQLRTGKLSLKAGIEQITTPGKEVIQ